MQGLGSDIRIWVKPAGLGSPATTHPPHLGMYCVDEGLNHVLGCKKTIMITRSCCFMLLSFANLQWKRLYPLLEQNNAEHSTGY